MDIGLKQLPQLWYMETKKYSSSSILMAILSDYWLHDEDQQLTMVSQT